jgi:glycosyltransferase involved in cell wall biosynthesis
MADAIIAVSKGIKEDVLKLFSVGAEKIRIIFNGIDPDEYRPTSDQNFLLENGIDPKMPYLLFVGRIARQKGIVHLVRAIQYFDPGFQVVLCAGAPDTPEIAAEMKEAVAAAQKKRPGIIWLEQMVTKKALYQLYSHAAVFCCPSIYEPFGIINWKQWPVKRGCAITVGEIP